VKNSPISESSMVGFGIGRALAGKVTIVEIMFGDFTTLIVDQLRQQASKIVGMYGTKKRIPLIIRTPMGGRRGYGPTHSQNLENMFISIPNIIVYSQNVFFEPNHYLVLGNIGLPIVIIEHKDLYNENPNIDLVPLYEKAIMDKNEILSNDIILIHTAYLGYYYYDFINNIKTNTTFFDIENVANINKHDNHDFNITKVLIDYNSDFNLKKKRQRLANILYKAINICYDKKTDFSKNLIKRTKEALNRYDKSTLLGTPNSIIFSDDEKNKYENFKNKITDITNGFEIEYYNFLTLVIRH
jgi:hypothetical protein